MQQKQLGQFYTNKNIFKNIAFIKWFNNISLAKRECVLEPFAGSNGIIKMLDDLGFINKFKSYDIMPRDKDVEYKDTIEDFPKNYFVCVTNPPFLAKNSATRRMLDISFSDYSDLYELCLLKCLTNVEYVAAIIPESFLTNTNFNKKRLHTVISLAEKNIFKDTEHPVCLALFNPEDQEDYKVYRNDDFLGFYSDLKEKEEHFLSYDKKHDYKLFWHHPEGQIGLEVIDATNKTKKIHFLPGQEINSEEVNLYSRLRTRLLILNKNDKPISKFKSNQYIKELNKFFNNYRNETQDVFLTAFKGLRSDQYYRRRLDFTKAREIVDAYLSKL